MGKGPIPKITSFIIEQYLGMYDKLQEQKAIASELKRTAEDQYGEREHEVDGPDGKKIKINEMVMWQEVFYAGAKAERYEFLKGLHPKVFEAYAKQDAIVDEIIEFEAKHFGFTHQNMTMPNWIKLQKAMFNHMMVEYEKSKK